jgi:integrase
MADKLPKWIRREKDQDTGEIFYGVTVKHKGKVIAMEDGFTRPQDAAAYYYKHIDKLNIEKIETVHGYKYRAEFYFKKGKGSRKRRKTFSTYRDAVAWRKKCREEHTSSKSDDASMTFKDLTELWLQIEVNVKRSENTKQLYTKMLNNHLFPIIKNVRLLDISKKHFGLIEARMINKKKSPSTIKVALAVLGRCLRFAWQLEILDKDIMHGYEKPKKQESEPEYWALKDIKLFLNYARVNSHYYYFYLTAIRTGMRRAELLGLMWDRIDFEKGFITVARNRTSHGIQQTTKSKKPRKVTMTSDLKKALLELKVKNQVYKSNYVFLNKNGDPIPYNTSLVAFKGDQVKSGVSKIIRLHDLRHTFASQFAMMGGGQDDLRVLLGHSDLKMTKRYTHYSDEHLAKQKEFIEKLNIGVNDE